MKKGIVEQIAVLLEAKIKIEKNISYHKGYKLDDLKTELLKEIAQPFPKGIITDEIEQIIEVNTKKIEAIYNDIENQISNSFLNYIEKNF
jgi:hypothetical protein